MLGGQLYNAQDGELQAMHRTAMELCHALNQLNPNQKEEARALLQQLLGRTGEHFTIKSTFWCDYGRHITIGENFFCNYNCVMLDCAPITFGNNVMVAPNCGFYTAAHPVFGDWLKQDIARYSLRLQPDYRAWDRPTGGSDNASFALCNIPIIWYHTDGHPDYHQPSDHTDRLNWEKMIEITKAAFLNAWNLANENKY